MVLKIIITVVLCCFLVFEIYDLTKKIINYKNYKKQKSNTNESVSNDEHFHEKEN